MSVYLGSTKIGINKIIEHSGLGLNINIDNYPSVEWTRPNDWPDLDSLNVTNSGADRIYMTYQAGLENSAIGLHVEGTNILVKVGSISNGSFISEETLTASSNDYIKWLDNLSGYKVVEITGTITKCLNIQCINANGQIMLDEETPMVERVAYIPNIATLAPTSTSRWGTAFLQHDKVMNGTGTTLTSLYNAWHNCRKLSKLEIDNFFTPNVTTMYGCFASCRSLIGTLDLRHWNVIKVTTMVNMFQACNSLKQINITGWITNALTNISSMFYACYHLENIIGIENLNVSNVWNLASLFQSCWSLQQLDLSQWNTGSLTSMSNVFSECYNIKNLNLSNWNFVNVTNFTSTFNHCENLKTLILPPWPTTNVTTVSGMFAYCRSLSTIDLTGFKFNGTSMYYAFYNCESLKELHFPSTWIVDNLATSNSINSVFANNESLISLTGIKDWNFVNVQNLNGLFSNCYSLKSLDVSNWKTPSATSISSLFSSCYSLESINVSSFDISKVTTLQAVFSGCYNLKNIVGLENWNTSKVTTMANMFAYTYSLKHILGIKNWDTSAVTNISLMFYYATSLEELDISGWDLSKNTTISTLCRYCMNLKTINLSNQTLSTGTIIQTFAFGQCYNLQNIIGITIGKGSINFTDCFDLTHESILIILNALPQVTTACTLNISTRNINRLTTAEKAIATNKGWTLAN